MIIYYLQEIQTNQNVLPFSLSFLFSSVSSLIFTPLSIMRKVPIVEGASGTFLVSVAMFTKRIDYNLVPFQKFLYQLQRLTRKKLGVSTSYLGIA